MKSRAFTLVELLVVVAVIGILTALTIPAVTKALDKGKAAKSVANLGQIGVALNTYAGEHENLYPMAGGDITYQAEDTDPTKWPWQQAIDSYIGSNRGVFRSPNLPEVEFGYYLGSRAGLLSTTDSKKEFGPVNRLWIAELSKHILGGECVYWSSSKFDADKDDYSQTPSFRNDGQKGVRTPILFTDGHVQAFDRFDPAAMTARYEGTGDGNLYPWSGF